MSRNKKTIRLTESDLHEIIKESVKTILKENDYMNDGNIEPQYEKFIDTVWDNEHPNFVDPSLYNDDFPHTVRRQFEKPNKEKENIASWNDFDTVVKGADITMKNRANNHYDNATKNLRTNRMPGDERFYDEYMNSYKSPKKYGGYFNGHMDDIKNDFDNQWEKSKEIDNYTKKANSKPLHRKGSLNREL